jgi:hypothetical protein
MPYGTINADVIQTSTSGGILGAGNASIMKNRIINGAMVINQRGFSGTPDTQYTLDRWFISNTAGSKFTVSQNAGSVTPPTGFSNYLGATSSSAYSIPAGDIYLIRQYIEGFNTADLGWGTASAKTVTLSFQVYSSLTGTFGGSIQNSANDKSYPFSYTVSSANTWTTASVTIAGDTSGTWIGATNGIGMRVNFSLGTGTTGSGTAGAWASANYYSATGAVSVVGTNGATFYITGVQLEVGTTATNFDYRSIGTELALCQRYFVKDLQDSTYATFLCGVVDTGTTANRCGMRFPVSMRTAPTAAVGGTVNPRIYDGVAAPAITSITGNLSSSFGASLVLTASGGGLTSGRPAIIIDNGASFITYSAEL